MRWLLVPWICCCWLIWVCNTGCTHKEEKVLTEEERIQLRIDSVKVMAQDGDLLTRLNDNIVSHMAKFINEVDKSYSHSGIVMTINNVKTVCHIDADEKGADTVRYESIDSFLNGKENLLGALYRYDLSPQERDQLIAEMNGCHDRGVIFDRLFDLKTDTALYCSEMVGKCLRKATAGRIDPRECLAPPYLHRMIYFYVDKKVDMKEIAVRPMISIDNLYRNPHCKELLKFQLKQFPGQ